jgi:5-methylthioadenosine/S-adenosylhomocysteine deaminase
MILRAKWVLPIAGPPIEDGAVVVRDGAIAFVGAARDLDIEDARVRDLGHAALLPGLVNAHSHLELTAMRGLLEMHDFEEWIATLTRVKMTRLTDEDLLDSSLAGALEAVRAGVTCVADTTDSGTPLDALDALGLRGIVYQETFGPDPSQAPESIAKLEEKVARLQERARRRVRVGVSPHAPYMVSADLFGRVARLALDRALPVAIHAAESSDEERFLGDGSGTFGARFERRGISWTPPGLSTIAWLSELGVLATRPLLIHAVRASDDDLSRVAEAGAGVAHCPKSNAKLGHGVAPLGAMLDRGIAVGLGTDSVASNNLCDMLDEARAATLAARARAGDAAALTARDALALATIGGARALGIDEQVGTLEIGKRADLCAVDLSGLHASPVYDVEAALVFSASARDVALTVVDGETLYDRDASEQTALDEPRLLARLGEVRARAVAP